MAQQPALHPLYHHYSELPYSLRIMYTATLLILGLGYLFGLIYVFHTYAGRGTGNKMMLSYEDLVVAYSGSGHGSRLESALQGPMSNMLPADDGQAIIGWIKGGADKGVYDTTIKPIMDKRCLSCHDGSNPHLPNLSDYDGLKKLTEQDTGTDVFSLVRVSHIHLFGLTFIFFIMGTMFSHAYVRPVWFKCAVVALPYAAIVMDVSSWYFTKLFHPFASMVLLAGMLMGSCFAFMWVVTMYQMWIARPPAMVIARASGDGDILG